MSDKEQQLIYEDFMGFSIGDFPYDREHSAMGEYHLYPVKGDCGIWNDPVCNYNYRGPSWMITEEDGIHFMEQMRVVTDQPHRMYPMLLTGQDPWKNNTVSCRLRLLNNFAEAGICICVRNSLNLIAVVFNKNMLRIVYRHKEEEQILAETPFDYGCDDFHVIKATNRGSRLTVWADDNELLSVESEYIGNGGKVGITASVPAQFQWFSVTSLDATSAAPPKGIRGQYPAMKLWKTINLRNFGCGRQIRFGHLTGTEEWHIVFAQCQKRVYKDAYATISCLTAVDLDGNILWQRGEPSEQEQMGVLSADVPLQVYDIDGDGVDEVITAKNFKIMILDGRTGSVKKEALTPVCDEPDEKLIGVPFGQYAFYRLNPDGIRIANLSGKDRPGDIILKDRYCRIYALNSDLELMWKFSNDKNTGHFPYAFDFNGDGFDEVFCGYNMISHEGKLLWTLPVADDHTDEIVIGRFMEGSQSGHMALVSGTEGFMITDYHGNILVRDKIGHAQRVSIGHYLGDSDRFGICVVNYWGHQGIIYMYDSKGNPLWERENGLNGNVLSPVNWKGDGTDLILLQADVKQGGLMDGGGEIAVSFPDDGHPVLCAEAIDLMGDARDELVVWDAKQMYIYTQEDNPKPNVYHPSKYPHYNASNYRGEYSYPDESYLAENLKSKIKNEERNKL